MMNQTDSFSRHNVYTAADVRAIDRAAIDGGIDSYALMTRAADFALQVAREEFDDCVHWQIVCGAGNNAGDGYVLARLAHDAGLRVSVCHVAPPEEAGGDARRAWQDAVAAGVSITEFTGTLDTDADLLVDAILGSGLARDVEGRFADAVGAMNAHPAAVFALDIPTGIHGDSGAVMGAAVVADVTATFVGRKAGLYLGGGPDHAGYLRFSTLEVPVAAYGGRTPAFCLAGGELSHDALPRRPRQSHKGDFGHVLVVGGGPGMPGAARLAGEAALRAGAGRVSVAAHPDNAAAIPAGRPELMCHAITSAAELEALLDRVTVVALGPGLGRDAWARTVFDAVRNADLPMVVDADALNLLAEQPDSRAARVLTPHPGEAARLLGGNTTTLQADRLAAVADLQARYGGTIVLKGCGTLISRENAPPWLVTAGNPGMATAGMGDVLTGVIAGLLAQGLDTEMAAAVAVEAHARAGDTAAATGGQRGMLASDVLQQLRPWLNPR